jgi:septum formation protein
MLGMMAGVRQCAAIYSVDYTGRGLRCGLRTDESGRTRNSAMPFEYTARMGRPIVLASSSPYRAELLARLRIPFRVEIPAVDETRLPDETHAATAERLARRKAQAAGTRVPGAIVIGADQVADLEGAAIGKPGTHDAALVQLLAMQGRVVRFHSGLAVLDTVNGECLSACVPTDVRFRSLSRAALDAYLRADQPYDCAGSAKIESLGICLVERIESEDPTALVGLPLIRLVSMLAHFAIAVPAP